MRDGGRSGVPPASGRSLPVLGAAGSRGSRWRTALDARSGRDYWRALEDLLDSPDFRAAAAREFPAEDPTGWALLEGGDAGIGRRRFLQLLGASMALAGVSGCAERAEFLLPYVTQPEDLTPGLPVYYATSMVLGGYATGLLVQSREGRPIKVEGNPEHPASLGAAGVYEQASVLELYDPYRLKQPHVAGEPAELRDLVPLLSPGSAGGVVRGDGAGLHLLLEPTSSPLLAFLIERLRERYPAAAIHFWSPLASPAALAGARGAFGTAVQPVYDLSAAHVVVALDADFLAGMPFHLRYAREWAARRRPSSPADDISRLYAAEPMPTPTGAMADHRLRVRASEVADVAAALLRSVGRDGEAGPAPADPGMRPEWRVWVETAARDLRRNAGRSLVIAGERQTAEVHRLAHLLNAALGNIGRTVRYTEPVLLEAGQASHGLEPLVEAMRAGRVETLAVVGGNPAYSAPADLDFAEALGRVPQSLCLALHPNETARLCRYVLPQLHYLESWGDARAYDGTVSFVQPLIKPLWGGFTEAELLALLIGDSVADGAAGRELLRGFWRGQAPAADFEAWWEQALQLGFLPETTAPEAAVADAATRGRSDTAATAAAPAASATRPNPASSPTRLLDASAEQGQAGLEAVFLQDPSVYDGRFAANAWLQELPDPLTKLTWGNAAILSPATAAERELETGDVVALRLRGRELAAPIFVLPGHADGSVSLRLGYGHDALAPLARGVGFDATRLRASEAPYFDRGLELQKLGREEALATTQSHWTMEGRPLALSATLAEYRAEPDFTAEFRGDTPSLYQPYEYEDGDQWAMAIDLTVCTGCSACVVACQAENNIPVVGPEGVLDGREMHWLRIDRYYTGQVEDPGVVFQPMLCQHCEQAPCEYVCPVNATVHSPDGLNEMIYNRCVGTRFCSNNCPYKVRRFNWFDYTGGGGNAPVRNPEVTVRGRGVMEKCTFCVQRIRRSQIAAKLEGRPLRPGEVRTACQQACPTNAIVFGSYTDPDAELLARLSSPRRYEVLHELGTEPRVKYLARIGNPVGELDSG